MTLRLTGTIPLPPHRGTGGFDHAAVLATDSRLFVAHPRPTSGSARSMAFAVWQACSLTRRTT